jgi:predicted P-loop ATPase
LTSSPQTTIDRALALAARGTPVFPCHNESKRPACTNGFKDASTDPDTIRALFAAAPADALIGIPTGVASGWSVLDLDTAAHRDSGPWLAANSHRLPPTLVQTTRSGGTHWYYRHVPDLRNSNDRIAPGVDIRADGGYVIAWGEHGCPLFLDEPVAPFPEWLADLAIRSQPAARSATADLSDLAPPSAAVVVALLDRMPNPETTNRETWLRVMLAAKGAQDALGDTGDEIPDAACRWAARWSLSLGFDVEREKWDSDFATRDAPLAGWRHLESAAGALVPEYRYEQAAAEFMAHPPAEQPDDAADPKWRHRLTRGDNGKVQGNLNNAATALQYAPDWRGVLGFCEFTGKLYLLARPPWDGRRGAWNRREITDTDTTAAAIWLQQNGIQVTSAVAYECMRAVGERRKFHPVREYLRGITWDGMPRLTRWLIDHAGAEDTALNAAISAKFLVAMVARVFRPGCKHDAILITEGAQGIGKSRMFRVLSSPEWFTDHLPDLSSKDAALQLRGIWVVEIAELDKFSKAEASRIKAYLSTPVDRLREPYGRLASDTPRQSVFAGTVNPGSTGYLKDETGNRRMWTVALGVGWPPGRKIAVAAITRDRDQMLAEALARFDAGESWWLDSDALESDQATAAAERMQSDPWEERIAEHIAEKPETSVVDVLAQAVGKPVAQLTNADMQRASAILKGLGWVKRKVRFGAGGRQWRYFRNANAEIIPLSGQVVQGLSSQTDHPWTTLGPVIYQKFQ